MLTREKLDGWFNDRNKISLKIDLKSKVECDHMCSGNCRRVGCNCECGEWHKESDVCEMCGGTGEVSCDERDRDGNWERGTGTQMCECRLDNEIDMSGASEGDR